MGARPDIPEAVRDQVVDRYLAGERVQSIVDEFGVSRAWVYLLLKQRGIASRQADLIGMPEARPVNVAELMQRLEAQAEEIGRLKAEVRALKRDLKAATSPQ